MKHNTQQAERVGNGLKLSSGSSVRVIPLAVVAPKRKERKMLYATEHIPNCTLWRGLDTRGAVISLLVPAGHNPQREFRLSYHDMWDEATKLEAVADVTGGMIRMLLYGQAV